MLPDNSSNKKSIRGLRQTDEAVAQDALNMTGFGKFNYKILAVSAFICMNSSFSTLSIGFVLPSAACDMKMTTAEKGHLTVAIMFGMFSSSYFWGCFADMKGRKTSLLYALFIHGVCELLSSLVQFYWCFLILKFISGLAICGQITGLFTYLAEFQPKEKRDKLLTWMEPAWVTGAILIACFAWFTIPLKIEYEVKIFTFHSWNLFIMLCSLPAFTAGICLIFCPETPKYLADTGQNAEMFQVLARMYSENTGNSKEEYFANLKMCDNQSLSELVVQIIEKGNEEEDIKKQSWKNMLLNIYYQTLILLKRPYLCRTIILCISSYLIMSSYYMLLLWFPDLFQRYAEFQENFPNQPASVCTVIIIQKNETIVETNSYGCDTPIQNSVYLYAFIIALAGIPTGFALPLLIDRVGYTFFLVIASLCGSVVTICLFLVKTSIDNLIVTCFFESLTSVCVSVVCCMAVDFYPTHLRSIAAGLAGFSGRLGSIIGNLTTGLLIDNHCKALILLVALQLLVCAILSLFTPKRRSMDKIEAIEPKKRQNSKT